MPAFATRSMRHGFVAGLALFIIFASPMAKAQNGPLCMSDDEFRAYLHEALLFQVGYGGRVCCARDRSRPNSCKEVTRQATRIEEVGAAYFRHNRETALRPFSRAFPGQAKQVFQRYSAVLEQRAKKFVDDFGEHECDAWLNAIEALSYLRENDLGIFLTTQLMPAAEFAEERRRVAICE